MKAILRPLSKPDHLHRVGFVIYHPGHYRKTGHKPGHSRGNERLGTISDELVKNNTDG